MGPRRLVVGISGSSGAIYGIRLLEALLRNRDIETHLVITPAGKRTIIEETEFSLAEVEALATKVYPITDIGAAIASGSFRTAGAVIAPCSIKTLSAVANSYADNLLTRAADVTLKEGRRLVLLVRETPLHIGHIRLMAAVAEAGGQILPPIPAFYNHPKTIEDIVDHTIGRVLDKFDIDHLLVQEWRGTTRRHENPPTGGIESGEDARP